MQNFRGTHVLRLTVLPDIYTNIFIVRVLRKLKQHHLQMRAHM